MTRSVLQQFKDVYSSLREHRGSTDRQNSGSVSLTRKLFGYKSHTNPDTAIIDPDPDPTPYLPSYKPLQFATGDLQQTQSLFLKLPRELRYEIYQYVFEHGTYHMDLHYNSPDNGYLEDQRWIWYSEYCNENSFVLYINDHPVVDGAWEDGFIEPCRTLKRYLKHFYDGQYVNHVDHSLNPGLLLTCRQT